MSINTPRTCDALGVCQGRTPPCQHTCQQAAHPFAPGTIEHTARRPRLAPWQRLVLGACGLLLASGLLGFAAGVLQAKGWPL